MMKKILSLLLVLLLSFTLTSCKEETPFEVDCDLFPTHNECLADPDPNPEPEECDDGYELINEECILIETAEDYLEVYYLNDFHGALLQDDDQIGASFIANLINTKKAANPDNVLFIVGGDILQGSALSNYYNGLSTINIFNEMQLDAFTVGNHEFDWGLDVLLDYADGNEENGEADFPFLGANIFYKGTTDIPDGIDPYTIIQKGDHKVGIIGTMGYGLEYAIAESKISDYEFGDPLVQIEYYSHYLRTVEDCDIIIVSAHDSGSRLNDNVLALSGDYKVDAIFNGHSHSKYANINDGVPVVQSGDNGEFVGYVKWTFTDGNINVEADNLSKFSDSLLRNEDQDVKTLLDTYILETDELLGGEIIVSGDYYSKGDLSGWLTELMLQSTNSDIAFHNYGGTRNTLDNGQSISLAVLYQIWPFDNVIKTVELQGSVINSLIQSSGMAYSASTSTFDNDTYYKVATNDYVFDKPDNPFIDGQNPENTGIVLRDLVENELELQALLYSEFLISNAILTTHTTYQQSSNPIKKEN